MLFYTLFILFFTIIVTIMLVTSSSSSTHLDTPIAMYAVDAVVFEGSSEVHVAVCISNGEKVIEYE